MAATGGIVAENAFIAGSDLDAIYLAPLGTPLPDNIDSELDPAFEHLGWLHSDGITEETRQRVAALVHCIDDEISIHDFRMVVGPTHTNVIFDAVVPFKFRLTDQEVEQKVKTAVRTLDGNYYAVVTVERSYT